MARTSKRSLSINDELKQTLILLNEVSERITALQDRIQSEGDDSALQASVKSPGKSAQRTAATKNSGAKKSASTSASSKSTQDLPDTTGNFFAKHIKAKKQSVPQIFDSVVEKLGFEPSSDQKKVLRNRLAAWLSYADKSPEMNISSEGTGREKRYFKV